MTTLQLLFTLSFLLSASPVHAATFVAEDDVTLSTVTQDDIYAAGETIRLTERVEGDAMLAGGQVRFATTIRDDLFIAGGEVEIDGTIDDDVRAAGGTIVMSATVADDVFLFGGEVHLREGTVINGDLHIFASEIKIDANVVLNGSVLLQAQSVDFNGNAYGPVSIDAHKVQYMAFTEAPVEISAKELALSATINGNVQITSKQVSVAEGTTISGNVTYWNISGESPFIENQVAGTVTYDEAMAQYMADKKDKHHKKHFGVAAMFFAVFSYTFLSAAFVILLALLFTKTYFVDAAKILQKEPGVSLWYGFLYVVATPFLCVLLLCTVIGIPLGLILGFVYASSFYFVKPLTSIVLAKVAQHYWKKKWKNVHIFFASLAVLLAWRLHVFIPILGTLASAIILLAGFGALAKTEWIKFKKVR